MTFVIKLKTKSGPVILNELTNNKSVADMFRLISEKVNIETYNISVLKGFPPKPVNLHSLEASLGEVGIVSGDTLIIQEKKAGDTINFTPRVVAAAAIGTEGIIVKQSIPGDNSCLFTSVGYAIHGGKFVLECAKIMRRIIAQSVANQPDKYHAAMLGKPNADYCNWILKPESWGGGIELAVLSEYFQIELAVLTCMNASINVFGEADNFLKRAYLLFDGLHYDALFLKPLMEGPIETVFSPMDRLTEEKMIAFTLAAKLRNQFTDTSRFRLKCMVCGVGLIGEKETLAHAHASGHNEFGEVYPPQ